MYRLTDRNTDYMGIKLHSNFVDDIQQACVRLKVLRVMGMQLSIEPIVRVRPTLEEMVAMNEEENRREWELAMRQTAIGERSRNAKNK